jgi:hypothetical protein
MRLPHPVRLSAGSILSDVLGAHSGIRSECRISGGQEIFAALHPGGWHSHVTLRRLTSHTDDGPQPERCSVPPEPPSKDQNLAVAHFWHASLLQGSFFISKCTTISGRRAVWRKVQIMHVENIDAVLFLVWGLDLKSRNTAALNRLRIAALQRTSADRENSNCKARSSDQTSKPPYCWAEGYIAY